MDDSSSFSMAVFISQWVFLEKVFRINYHNMAMLSHARRVLLPTVHQVASWVGIYSVWHAMSTCSLIPRASQLQVSIHKHHAHQEGPFSGWTRVYVPKRKGKLGETGQSQQKVLSRRMTLHFHFPSIFVMMFSYHKFVCIFSVSRVIFPSNEAQVFYLCLPGALYMNYSTSSRVEQGRGSKGRCCSNHQNKNAPHVLRHFHPT